jgi:Leucine-rich repeat (LRR) protein
MKNNEIEEIPEGVFENLPNLKYLDLKSNKISKIHPNAFENLSKLKILDLRQNVCINEGAYNEEDVKKLIQDVSENKFAIGN